MQLKNVCIFASSSDKIEEKYCAAAMEIGMLLAKRKIGMVFGGGRIGLMGAAAKGVHAGQGRIIGVIPEKLNVHGIAFEHCTKLIVTPSMHERKQTMETLSDAFIALPGGFGTLEELLEVITLKQLGYHNKPIVLLDLDGFFTDLLCQFEKVYETGFADARFKGLYCTADTPEQALLNVAQYIPQQLPDKLQQALEVVI